MPDDEGMALYNYALDMLSMSRSPMIEIGSYCGKSSVYLGAAAKEQRSVLFSIDHHRGSEENQLGWEHHDPELYDPTTEKLETLPLFRKTITLAKLDESVIAVIGNSKTVSRYWNIPISLLFIDGGHSLFEAMGDYLGWSQFIQRDGLLLIHDVFEDESQGGRAPYEVFVAATSSKSFKEIDTVGSLKVLKKL